MTTATLKKETLFGGFLQFIIMVKKHDPGRQDAGEGAECSTSRLVG